MSAFKGFLVLIGMLAGSSILSLGLGWISIGAVYAAPAFFAFLFIMVILFPYILGRAAGKWGWLMGLSYSVILLFAIEPLALWGIYQKKYFWFIESGARPPYWNIPVVIAIGVLAGGLAHYLPPGRILKGRMLFPLNLERPLASILPILCIALLLSGLAPLAFIRGLADIDPESTMKFPNYHLEVLKPRDWYWLGSREVVSPPHRIEEWAERRIEMHERATSKYKEDWKIGLLNIFVYSKMPFTGTPLTDYISDQEVYDNLRALLEEVKNNPFNYFYQYKAPSGNIESYNIADYMWYGPTTICGHPAIGLKYKEYKYQEGLVPDKPLPAVSSTPDIVVYKAPYLYWLEFSDNVSKEDYKTIVDGFKFI